MPNAQPSLSAEPALYSEKHRPRFHFSPPAHWMNDPNGLVYLDGEYHLFYQYNPYGTVWGPMHWGHAVSRDLVHWENMPFAIGPDRVGQIWSGSAVVDWNNSSGLGMNGVPPMVAIYTAHNKDFDKDGLKQPQSQAIAYSIDRGRSWRKYDGNPVLPNPGDKKDFRDPKVFWHAASHQWIMILAAGDHSEFYGSPNLRNWRFLSEFGRDMGAHGGVWECPDLLPLTVGETGETRWVLLQSINPGAPNGGSGTQYFVGDFDGTRFTPDPSFTTMVEKKGANWLDWGRDNYASVTWSDMPKADGRRIMIGWMTNWDYAENVPTQQWRGATTVPRTLGLRRTEAGLRLYSWPVKEIDGLRGAPRQIPAQRIDGTAALAVDGDAVSAMDMLLRFDRPKAPARFGLLFANAKGEALRIGYDGATDSYFIDRRKAGDSSFSGKFATAIHSAPRLAKTAVIDMRLLMDAASAEMFADDGLTAMTDTFFPTERFDRVSLFSEGGSVQFNGGVAYPMQHIWSAPGNKAE